MLAEAMTALAMAGGVAVVQAAGTDAWGGLPATSGSILREGRPSAGACRIGTT